MNRALVGVEYGFVFVIDGEDGSKSVFKPDDVVGIRAANGNAVLIERHTNYPVAVGTVNPELTITDIMVAIGSLSYPPFPGDGPVRDRSLDEMRNDRIKHAHREDA